MNTENRAQKSHPRSAWAGVTVTVALLALTGLLTVVAAQGPRPMGSAGRNSAPLEGNYGGNFRFPRLEPSSLDPADADFGNVDSWIVSPIFEGLTRLADDLGPIPAIAQSWASSDGQNWTFHLRPGIRFHNGRLVTAQDVVYSWDRVAAAHNEWYEFLVAPLISTKTAVDSGTVQVTLSEPYASFPSLLALPFMSVIPSETVGTIDTQPVGSGPFRFQNWTAGDSLVVIHNDDYYKGRPYLDSITYQFYADEGEMFDDYLLGNLDLSPVPGDRITEVLGSPNALFVNGLGLYYYGMKVDRAPFDDPLVRRAFNYAVDRQAIVNGPALGYRLGYPFVAEGPVPPGMQGYDPPVPDYSYDPAQALNLLAQAGWEDGNGDGILDDGVGTDLRVELWYAARFPQDAAMANSVAGDLRNIGGSGLGATVVVSSTDWATYLGNLDQYPMYALTWLLDFADPYDMLAPHFGTEGQQNHTNYSNPQVDAWLDQTRATLDLWERQALYESIETQVQTDAPFINLFYMAQAYVKGDAVVGLVIPPLLRSAAIQMERVQLFFDSHDIEPQSILYPKPNTLIGAISPTVKVRNAGSSTESDVPVRCRILRGGTELYSQMQTIDSLAPFATQVIAFPSWTPPVAGNYTFEFTSLLPGDEKPANDQETLAVTVTDVAFYDGYTRDHAGDSGTVPTAAWWQSPDVLVRHTDDQVRRHQDPILGQTNYVYVKVRNIGNGTISDGYVNAYWHNPSVAILCGDWGLINPTPIPVGTLAPGESKWVMTPWVPPVEGHTCLFSRFWSGDDPVTFECDVPWDNNIAQRNVEVVELEEGAQLAAMQAGRASVVFEVGNVRDLPATADLIVERGSFPSNGGLVLEFSRDLFGRWQDGGGRVEGGVAVPDSSQIEITDWVSATVMDLPLDVRERQQIRMLLDGPPDAEFELHVTERMDGIVIGGMTYRTTAPSAVYLPVVLRNSEP